MNLNQYKVMVDEFPQAQVPGEGGRKEQAGQWDVHFGILKTIKRTARLFVSPLDSNWGTTDSAVWRYVHFTLALV